MMNKLFELIEKRDQENVKNHGEIWSISRREIDIEEFLDFILEYFGLDSAIKDKWQFEYPNEREYMNQKHKYLNYVKYLLDNIKPMLLLAFKLSELRETSEMFEKKRISEDAIVNMIDNFLTLNRTGRPRKIYPTTLDEFKKFKLKYQNIITFFRELRSPNIKSIKDYAELIMKFKITRSILNEYKSRYELQFKQYVRKSSKKTLYRYDKDFIFIQKTMYSVDGILEHWTLYENVDKEYFSAT